MKRVLILAALLCGCAASPTEQCDTFVQNLCAKFEVCGQGSASECEQQIDTVIPCGRAIDVSAAYDECLADIDKDACGVLFPSGSLVLPANCKGVVILK